MLRTAFILTTLSVSVMGLNSSAVLAQGASPCAELKGLDTNNDGKLDLNEAKAAATQLFDKLDRDKDGTLDAKELKGHMTRRELRAANPDKDKTLSKDEFLAAVEKRFNAANPDKDGTIECKEARKKAGKALLKLLK
jgi:Ca2+-binding EF-hand superfamily protein